MASTFSVVSWNVRGLGDPAKRFAVLDYLRPHLPAIVCLQETHFIADRAQYFHRSWMSHTFHSTFSNYARGVSILVHKSIPFVVKTSRIDPDGRYICLHCMVYMKEYLLISVYIPPPYNDWILRELLTFINSYPDIPIVMVGDFNNTIHPYWDRFGGSQGEETSPPSPFGRLLEEVSLWDLWRIRHPAVRQFSCYTSSHEALSRIDLMLGSQTVIGQMKSVEYLPMALSDHSPVLLCLCPSPMVLPSQRLWSFNSFWLQVIDSTVITQTLQEYFTHNVGSASKGIVWDAMKACLRGILIQGISRAKLKSRQFGEFLRDRVSITESEFVERGDPLSLSVWKEAQEAYNVHVLELARTKQSFRRQQYFEEGEKAGHLLALISRAQVGPTYITAMRNASGQEVFETQLILPIFHSFYSDLYQTRLSYTQEDISSYLPGVSLTVLSADDRDFLNGPLQLVELEEAVSAMANNKLPGADGLPVEIYKKFGDILLPQLFQVFQEAMDAGSLPPSMQEAIIVVIPKSGKDLLLPDSYRPISLLPADIKILAKVLTTRLSKVMSPLIHLDQSGFMPGRSTAINIRRLYLNMQLPVDNPGDRVTCSLDAAKAFDSIEWNYLWEVLRKFGLGDQFISWVRLLYGSPTARLRVNGCFN